MYTVKMTTPQITHETITDIPLLMHILHDQLEYDKLLGEIDPPHGNWQGLSLGKTMVTWLTHILSEGNHYMSHVQGLGGTIAALVGRLVGTNSAPAVRQRRSAGGNCTAVEFGGGLGTSGAKNHSTNGTGVRVAD